MSLVFYHALHVIGVIVLFVGLGGLAALALVDAPDDAKKTARKLLTILHGTALVVVLVGGFGALAKLGLGFPLWVMVKVVLWVFFGGVIVLFKRVPDLGKVWLLLVPVVGALAAYLGVFKPF